MKKYLIVFLLILVGCSTNYGLNDRERLYLAERDFYREKLEQERYRASVQQMILNDLAKENIKLSEQIESMKKRSGV